MKYLDGVGIPLLVYEFVTYVVVKTKQTIAVVGFPENGRMYTEDTMSCTVFKKNLNKLLWL